jgi:dephospho-CoA kinase
MRVIGLTGGIGMGKSTAAAVFRRARVPVFDADATVHRLQAPGGAALKPIAAAFPGSVTNGVLNRAVLREAVLGQPEALPTLEKIMHPLVRQAEATFLGAARRQRARLAVLDIPLLFETGADARVDKIVVVSAPKSVQMARLKARKGMTAAQIGAVLARQWTDAARRRRADWVVRTGLSRHHALVSLRRLMQALRA